jgi:hypothetical protein
MRSANTATTTTLLAGGFGLESLVWDQVDRHTTTEYIYHVMIVRQFAAIIG